MSTSTWKQNPTTNEWNSAANWSPEEVPMDQAIFSVSSQTTLSFAADSNAQIGTIEFDENSTGYTFRFATAANPALTICGAGVRNHSQIQQSFIVAATSSGYKNPQLKFLNAATAGGNNMFYCAGPETAQGYGGGVICFHDSSSAGSAIFKVWTGAEPPPKHSTVGGEVSFCDSATADQAIFTIYGTLGTDGDTFGNVVFHNNATAAHAHFINIGGTVSGGDGGNTQFYGNSSAAWGIYNNRGGTHPKANGGDVAFDATADGGHGHFYNHAASAAGAYGGVTSFNNNPPSMSADQGASAGNGKYFNYGARDNEQGGGGHLEFSAKYGSPTAANAEIHNYGSSLESKSSAGHSIFSINQPTDYYPTAGNASIWNHPASKNGAAGFTEFSVYQKENVNDKIAQEKNIPSAGSAMIINMGSSEPESAGGYTIFSGSTSAAQATLVAQGGSQGGAGGRIMFYDDSQGAAAKVQLYGNGELDIRYHSSGLSIATLELNGGVIAVSLGDKFKGLAVTDKLFINSKDISFYFSLEDDNGFAFNQAYTLVTSTNLDDGDTHRFSGNSIEGIEPTFKIIGSALQVIFVR
ncbi:MAG: hypothetical protein MI976_25330 [Pseudomonadales bacterium]|nr:hypothetical protein [Pseudomonadales bacterium]